MEDALARLGLNRREANEFIVYWLPRMEPNPYNLISFQEDAYTDHAVLTITPEPDSLLRVFMAWRPLEAPVEIPRSGPACLHPHRLHRGGMGRRGASLTASLFPEKQKAHTRGCGFRQVWVFRYRSLGTWVSFS